MREINKIGVFIRNGLTSAEIKKKVKDFPDNPDNKYFINDLFEAVKKNASDTLRKQQVHINLNLQKITQFCYNNKK